MFNLPTIKDYNAYVSELRSLDKSLESLMSDIVSRRKAIEQELEATSHLKESFVEYEKKSAPILRHYDSRSGASEGHDIRELSDGTIVCTSCPAAVKGNKDCWAVKDYRFRSNAFSSESYDPFGFRFRSNRY